MLRVVAIYGVGAWLVLQIAETILEPLGFPIWVMRAVVLVAIAGFPLAFLLAWIIDLRPEGLIFDLPLWTGESQQPRAQKKTDALFAILLVLVFCGGCYFLIGNFLPEIMEETPAATPVNADAPPNSIAVLAFANFGGQTEADYFAAGLADEILTLLATIDGLNVASRTSSFQFREKSLDIREIAQRLNVRYVLEGSARQTDKRVRVTAQLIDGTDGYHRWTDRYERPLNDVFAIQQEIAASVVNELRIALSIEVEQELRKRPTEDIDAYVYYLEGRGRLRSSLDADVMQTASQLFEKALAIDPDFTRAWAGLCEAQLQLYNMSDTNEFFVKAEAACARANEQEGSGSTEALIALGKLYRFRGMFELAEEQLAAAIELDPGAVEAYIELGQIREARQDLAAAESYFQRAIDLKRQYWRAYSALAAFYHRTERYDEAATNYEVATELAPDVASLYSAKGGAYWMLGDLVRARKAYETSLRLKPTRQGYTNLGSRFYYAGEFDNAVQMQKKALELAPEDHRLWGRLAESYRFVEGSEALANDAYIRAAQQAEESLKINPEDWLTIGLLGLYYAHLGRDAEAIEFVERATQRSNRNPDALYFQALVLLKLGQPEDAITLLTEAVESNVLFAQFMRTDPDLQQLNSNERFVRLQRMDSME